MLSVKLGRIKLRNPTILASGILGSSGYSLLRIAGCGAGAVVTKSIGRRREPYPGPNIIELEFGYLNAMGLPSPGVEEFVREIQIAKLGGIPVIASIFARDGNEFAEIAGRLGKHCDGVELNLSCPHVKGYGAEIGGDPEMVRSIVRKVKRRCNVPVWVKLSVHSNIVEMGIACERSGADAVVAINTVRAMAIDHETLIPLLGNKVGGLSGRAIKPIALRCVYELYENLKIPVIGAGGVCGWEDAVEFISAGASAVQIGSAAGKDPEVFRKVADGLRRYLRRKRMSLEELIGASHRR